MSWQLLENILRNYHEFVALYESEGLEEIHLDNGIVVNVYDVLEGIKDLPKRQKQAVVLVCIENRREVDVAAIMGFTKWSSQVGTYKRLGLKKIVKKYWPEESRERRAKEDAS